MSEAPEISVLMGVHNGGAFLAQALTSVLDQTFTTFELIVVDDASDDETPETLSAVDDPRLVVIRNEENLGLTRSLNRALAASRGRLIARQDADDRSLFRRLERQRAFLAANPKIALCGTWARWVDAEGRSLGAPERPAAPEQVESWLEHGNPFFHGSIMARRELMEELGGYRSEFRYSQDYDLYLRALGRFRMAMVPEELYELRLHRDTLTSTRQEVQDRFRALAQHLWIQRRERGQDDLERGAEITQLLTRVQSEASGSELWSNRAFYRLMIGDMPGYRRALGRQILARPSDPRPYIRLALSAGGKRAVQKGEQILRWLRGSRSSLP